MLLRAVWVACLLGAGSQASPMQHGASDADLRRGGSVYVAEFEWEQWALPPPTYNATESAAYRGPGPRLGASLWRDRAGRSWWLFGGRQRAAHPDDALKVYSDLWRYDVAVTRRWSRVFPSDDGRAKASGIVMLRAWLQSALAAGNRSGIVLCGRSEARRPEDRSLAVYGARSGRSDTVWQMELKDGLWTAYVCCCDSTDRSDEGHPRRHRDQDPAEYLKPADNNTQENALPGTSSSSSTSAKDPGGPWSEQQRPPPTRPDVAAAAPDLVTSRPAKRPPGAAQPAPLLPPSDRSRAPPQKQHGVPPPASAAPDARASTEPTTAGQTPASGSAESRTAPTSTPALRQSSPAEPASAAPPALSPTPPECEFSDEDEPPPCPRRRPAPPPPAQQQQAFCPDFDSPERGGGGGAQPIAWCDTRRELLAALDLRGSPLRLWQFDLRTSHWTQHQVLVENGSLWPGCADGSARHASAGDLVLVVCAPYGSAPPTSTRLVYALGGAGPGSLRALGQLQLDAAFEEPGGDSLWADEARTILQAGDIGGSRTVLLLAYRDQVALWLRDGSGGFWPVEVTWKGAALKWFRSFSSPLYHLSVAGQPWVLPNPRDLQMQDYWPVERGRFLVRFLDSSDANASPHAAAPVAPALPPPPSLHVSPPLTTPPAQPSSGVKAIVFFGLSLSIFAVFGAAVFVRRCVTCPPARREADAKGVAGLGGVGLGGGSSSQAPVVRYSAIPDDLGYPAA